MKETPIERTHSDNCEQCGQSLEKTNDLVDYDEVAQVMKEIEDLYKEQINDVTKVTQALIVKLDKANKQLKNEQTAVPGVQGQDFEQQLASLKTASMERQKLQEQKVAIKMQKLQSRFAGN
ncbi:MAG: hypothetical protein HRT58_09750 [Crocinitomicaceae bacterium]|nr:hypothetical protein [Flavobacteriales bacterium]NQZ35939.1 hypothetical protein [Crocinitomicaceae bacterium]